MAGYRQARRRTGPGRPDRRPRAGGGIARTPAAGLGLGVAVLAAGLVAWLPGLRPALLPRSGPAVPPLAVYWAADVSASQSARERRRLCGLMDETVEAALPKGTRVRVWTFARDAEPVYAGTPRRARDLWRLQDEVLKRTPEGVPAGTRPAAALEEIARELRQAPRSALPAALVLAWDGEDADPAATRRLVSELAASPRLRAAWVAGVPATATQPLRARVEREFRPLLGDRLVVSGPYDAAAGLETFRTKIGGD